MGGGGGGGPNSLGHRTWGRLLEGRIALLTESNGSFYTFDPHAKNHDGMPNSNGTATVLKFGDLGELGTFLCSLPNELKCEYF